MNVNRDPCFDFDAFVVKSVVMQLVIKLKIAYLVSDCTVTILHICEMKFLTFINYCFAIHLLNVHFFMLPLDDLSINVHFRTIMVTIVIYPTRENELYFFH